MAKQPKNAPKEDLPKKTYEVTGSIRHDGENFRVGELIELTELEAEGLAVLKVINSRPVDPPTPPAPPPEAPNPPQAA